MSANEEHELKLAKNSSLNISTYNIGQKHENSNDCMNFLLLNSSFFNRLQWKKYMNDLSNNLNNLTPMRFITYEYAGFVSQKYTPHKITINDYLSEIDSILEYFQIKKVNLFGISIGAWVGLNYVISRPEKVLSYCGYGNLAPFIPEYKDMRKERFDYIRNSVDFIKETNKLIINKSNWEFYFDRFYSPTFFNSLHKITLKPKTIEIFKRILFPMVSGNNMAILSDYYHYITETMIEEGIKLEKKLHEIPTNIPILLLNGLEDNIAYPKMTQALHSLIPHSKMELYVKLGHGSVLLGKGLKPIISAYTQFLIRNHLISQ